MDALSQFGLPLKTLNLGNCGEISESNPIKNEGVEYLEVFSEIVHLNLYNTKINANGILRLSQMGLNNLWFLNLSKEWAMKGRTRSERGRASSRSGSKDGRE